MDYFILGLWTVTLIVVCVIFYKVNKLIKFIQDNDEEIYQKIKDINDYCYHNNILANDIHEDLVDNTNSILDRIAELTGTVTISGGKICKILDIVDAKDKAFITATDTLRSEQSVKTRNKAKSSKVSKKATTIRSKKDSSK